jgi:Gas vesicle protein
MGYEYEREGTSASTKLTYLLIGGGIGAVIALLFAPKSGVELREDIADATRKGIEKGKETAAQLQEKAGDYYEVGRERAGELYQTAQEKAGEYAEKAKSPRRVLLTRSPPPSKPARTLTLPKNAVTNQSRLPRAVRAIRSMTKINSL